MAEKTKDELKRDKASRIIVLANSGIGMLEELIKDVEDWSGDDEPSASENMEHQIHQNETCANLQFLIDYLQNKHKAR